MLLIIILVLFIASLFSLLETATVAISEHKLLAIQKDRIWARYALILKQNMQHILIFSLFGNSLFNAVFTSMTTLMVAKAMSSNIHQEFVLPISTLFIALFIIIFSEAVPKIIASKAPTSTLAIIVIPLYYLYILSRPIIWMIDKIVSVITIVFSTSENATLEEIKAMIADKRLPFKDKHRSILLNSMELENLTVKEVLIPLRMVEALNIESDIAILCKQIYNSHHTRIIVYTHTIDNIIGYLHIKDMVSLNKEHLTCQELKALIRPIEFVSDFIPIVKQINLANRKKTRIFVVVNEYGDISGIACLEDMLEMVFGNFTTVSPQQKSLSIQIDESHIIADGTMLLRELNADYHLNIAISKDAMTLNGFVLNILKTIPNVGICFKLNNLIFEIISVGPYWVERVHITILKN